MTTEVLDAPKLSTVKVYNPIEAGIALMLEKHGHVLTTPPVVTHDAVALAVAKADRRELVKFRTTLEAARKAEKAESLAYGKLVDGEAARIQAYASPIENAYSAVIDAEEGRIEAEIAAAVAADNARIEAIQTRISTIKGFIVLALECRTSERVEGLIERVAALPTTGFDEFETVATEARTATLERLKQISDVKFAEEAEAKRIKAEQEVEATRLQAERKANEATAAAQRELIAAQQAENTRKAAELEAQRQAAADAQAAQQAKFDADLNAFEDLQAETAATNQAEAYRLAAERAALEAKPETAGVIIAEAAIETVVAEKQIRPTEREMLEVLVQHYKQPQHIVFHWLYEFDYDKLSDELLTEKSNA